MASQRSLPARVLVCVLVGLHQLQNTHSRENDTFYLEFSETVWTRPVERQPCAAGEGGCYPLESLFLVLGWSQAVFIVDESSQEIRDDMAFTNRALQTMVFQHDSVALRDWLMNEASPDSSQSATAEVNITVLCSVRCVKGVLGQVKRLDELLGTTCKLRSSANWVIAVTSGRLADLQGTPVPLDNVIVLTPSAVRQGSYSSDVFTISCDVYTLMWREDGRSLDRALRISPEADRSCAKRRSLVTETGRRKLWPNKKFGFNGRVLSVVIKEWSRTTMSSVTTDASGRRVKHWTGLFLDLFHMLQSALNFTYTLKEPSGDSWGITSANTTYGMTGDVISGRADVGLAPFFMTSELSDVLDFPFPVEFMQIVMVWRDPASAANGNRDGQAEGALSSLSPAFAAAVLGSLLFVTALLCLLEYVHPVGSFLTGRGQEERQSTVPSDSSLTGHGQRQLQLPGKPIAEAKEQVAYSHCQPSDFNTLEMIPPEGSESHNEQSFETRDERDLGMSAPEIPERGSHAQEARYRGWCCPEELHRKCTTQSWCARRCARNGPAMTAIVTRAASITVGAALRQGSLHLPSAWSGRALVSAWWLTCLVLAGAYNAYLAAHLSVAKQRPLFDSLWDLVGQRDYTWGLSQNSSLYLAMAKADQGEFRAVVAGVTEFRRTDPAVLSDDLAVHMHKVMTQKYVYIEGRRTIESIGDAYACDLQLSRSVLVLPDSLLLRRNSVLTRPFSDLILQMYSSGLMAELNNRWFSPLHCPDGVVAASRGIALGFLQTALRCVGGCLLASSLVLAAEVIRTRRPCWK